MNVLHVLNIGKKEGHIYQLVVKKSKKLNEKSATKKYISYIHEYAMKDFSQDKCVTYIGSEEC